MASGSGDGWWAPLKCTVFLFVEMSALGLLVAAVNEI
jgi:hypothetical protein